MKIIKSLSMLTALLIVGACSTAPRPTGSAALRSFLGGKAINLNAPDLHTTARASFTPDVSSVTIAGTIEGDLAGTLMDLKSSTDTSATFVGVLDGIGSFTVSSVTSLGGSFSLNGTTGTFTYQK